MDYRVIVFKGKSRETLVVSGCSCASEAESKALQKHPGFSIYDISRCGDGTSSSKEKVSIDE
jgi:hypothetical protein